MEKKYLYSLFLSLLICFTASWAHGQGRVISGTVLDPENNPLPGATVRMESNPNIATSTDEEGHFELEVSQSQAVLIVSFIGMEEQKIPIGTGDHIIVSMDRSSRSLSDLVVVGYGTTKKSDLTGSVSKISGDDLNRTLASSVGQLLHGQVPGLQVFQNSGRPGADVTIRIRGASSINGDNSPLLVVDGVPWGDAGNLKQINPYDIESIEVLKDASSAAIYGSRGANGVIMITTKKGKAGQSHISFEAITSISTLANKPDVWRNAIEEATIANEAAANAGVELPFQGKIKEGTYFPSLAELRGIDLNKPKWPYDTDWRDLILRNPVSQSYTLSANGGTEKTQYVFSLNYFKQEGLAIKNHYDKYIGRLNIDQELTKAIKVGGNVVIAQTNNTGLQLSDYIGRSRVFPAYDSAGNYFKTGAQDFGNPIALANEVLSRDKTFDLMGTIKADIQITPWLQFESRFSDKFGNSIGDRYDPKDITGTGHLFNGQGTVSNWNGNNTTFDNYFTFNKVFGKDHNLTLVAGYSTETDEVRTSGLTGRDFVNDDLKNENLNSAVNQIVNNGLTKTVLNSWLGRANYILMDKYLVTFTARADGSSKFGANNKWAFFPSGAVAWKINEEQFMNAIPSVSELKLRVSYGITGNQGISPYQTLDRLGTGKYWNGTNFETGFGPGISLGLNQQSLEIFGGLANHSLKWETTRSWDIGLDLGFLDQRYTATIDLYDKSTHDLLRETVTAPSSGYGRQWVNDGNIRNRGIEVGLQADVLSRSEFTWNIGGTFSLNRNKVISMGESDQVFSSYYIELVRQAVTSYTVGQPLYAFYGYKTNGIVQSEEDGFKSGLVGDEAKAGEIKYVDVDGNDVVDANDRTIIGNPNPDFTYSLNTNLNYKGFNFSLQLYGVQGNDVFNLTRFSPSAQLKRWTPDNPNNEYPSVNSNRGWQASDWFVQKGSFLRIQNVTLGYTFRPDLIRWIDKLHIYLSANNLYTFTKFPAGYDPEVGENGVFEGTYPRTRDFSFGINIGF